MKLPGKTWISTKVSALMLALLMAVSLVLAPVSAGVAKSSHSLSCTSACEKTCSGCHEGMKCCRVSAPQGGSEPVRSTSSDRTETGSVAFLAIAAGNAPLLYMIPPARGTFPPAGASSCNPLFTSLERLCVRLI